MGNTAAICLLFALVILLTGCGSKSESADGLPSDFDSLTAKERMEYLVNHKSPEEVARYICDAALENDGKAFIGPTEARAYAYEHYNDEQIGLFEQEIAKYMTELPIDERMRFTMIGGLEDMDAYSLEIGLTYVNDIRDKKKNISKIEEELYNLRVQCADHPEYYSEFMKGFKQALELYRQNVDQNIYLHFISYPDKIQ